MISYNWDSIILEILDNFYVISLQVLIKRNKTVEGYIKIHGTQPPTLGPKR